MAGNKNSGRRTARDERLSETITKKINATKIINRLQGHINGNFKMDPSQVTAGLGLLKKVVPDLQSVDMTATHEITDSLAELLREIDGQSRVDPIVAAGAKGNGASKTRH